jgi:hypothetical protein
LLPAPYFYLVYTLPGPIADIAYQNKAVIYDILFKASAETMITIARRLPRPAPAIGMGGLFEEAIRRTRSRSRVPRPATRIASPSPIAA